MMFATEVEFSGQLYLVMRRLKWWLLVVAAACALGGAFYAKQHRLAASSQGHFSLSDTRVGLLASDYRAIAANTQLFIGALEVDELARFSLLMDSSEVWGQLWRDADWCKSQPKLCARTADEATALTKIWKPAFAQEHKRRGNLLFFRFKAPEPALAEAVLNQLISQAEALDQQTRLQRLQQQQQQLQQAMEQASTVGERSLLAQQLDQNLAAQNLWRQGYYPALKPVASLQTQVAKSPSLLFSAVAAALLGTLLALTLALLFLRR
jgi:hypothetical protein